MATRGTQKAAKRIIKRTTAEYSNRELAKGQSTEYKTSGMKNSMDADLSAKGPRKNPKKSKRKVKRSPLVDTLKKKAQARKKK